MKEIRFEFLCSKPSLLRWDIFPFVFVYPVLMPIMLVTVSYWIFQIFFVSTLLFQGILFLLNYWAVIFRARFRFSTAKDINRTSHVLVTKHFRKEDRYRSCLCPLLIKTEEPHTKYVDYYKQEYLYDESTKTFKKPPTKEGITFKEYLSSTGIGSTSELKKAISKYGNNTMEIPMPKFADLFKEHVVAPFFVFQIFSSALWLLEEHWYLPLFNLAMLFIMECIVAGTRMKNMERIRGMRMKHKEVLVYRNKSWKLLNTKELVPGDLVCLQTKAKGESDNYLPCDMLLLSGTCTVNESILTGESIPQIKEPIQIRDNLEEVFSLKLGQHKSHILWGRTEVLQCIYDPDKPLGLNITAPSPRQYCIGYVLRTGFNTTQGKLVRTVLFSAERVSLESREAFTFLLVLLCFAIVSSGYTLYHGLLDPNREKHKVIIKSIILLTCVVPPELPIELSLAVNNSILTLIKHAIYCTEPYRMPSAGKVTICCFDKTGTLTSDKMIMNGVANSTGQFWELKELRDKNPEAMYVLGLCHSLAQTDNKTMLGDPLERLGFEGIEWKYNPHKERGGTKDNDIEGLIIRRYQFDSSVKRMSVIARISQTRGQKFSVNRVLTKGAPEILRGLLHSVPEGYDKTVKELTKKGYRVLCLAYRELDEAVAMLRSDAERDLIFCGLIVTSCPLKIDTQNKVTELLKSKHKVVVITGDNKYTASYVAQQLGICSSDAFYLHKGKTGISISDLDEEVKKVTNDPTEILEFIKGHSLCIDGEAIKYVIEESEWSEKQKVAVTNSIQVFARTSSSQKDQIIGFFKKYGEITLMCGDGTNDVGSLKRAHIGIALINKEQTTVERQKRKENYRRAMMMDSLDTMGDACIAAPFTYKYESIKCVTYILRQGRCTLVTTLQMYKILAINSIMLSYSLSALYLLGLKTGDFQATIFGLLIVFYFFLISKARPMKTLQPFRPPNSIFNFSQLFSVFFQLVIHFLALIYVSRLAYAYTNLEDIQTPDEPFKPTVMNTVVFLYLTFVDATTFVINYPGVPFMESLTKNKLLVYLLLAHVGIILCATFDLSEGLRYFLELHELPKNFPKQNLIGTMIGDFALCYGIQSLINYILYRN